jgi:hypothetical protein
VVSRVFRAIDGKGATLHSVAECGTLPQWKAMPSKNRVTINLSDEEASALDHLSEKSKVSKAWLGRHAICSLLERTQGDHNQLPLPLTELARKEAQ